MLRAVIFDLWGTLVLDPPERSGPRQARRVRLTAAALSDAGVAAAEAAIDTALRETSRALSALHDDGLDVDARGRVRLFLERLGLNGSLPEGALEALESAVVRVEAEHYPEVAPGALETLVALRELGMRTGLVSNAGFTTAPTLRALLRHHGLLPHLEGLVFSDEMGRAKPAAAMFESALDQVGVAPEEAAFVGDSPHNDVYGARSAGLYAIQVSRLNAGQTGYTERPDAVPHARIEALGELLPALRGLALLAH
jgi:putative hydrolase of the HAD superfamily